MSFAVGLLQGVAGSMNARASSVMRGKELSALEAMGRQPSAVQDTQRRSMGVMGAPASSPHPSGGATGGRRRGVGPVDPDRASTAASVYHAFVDTGFSPAQARALTAEINRENSFRPEILFGTHSDPHNRATNVGILSWQGSRASRLMDFLNERGQLDERGQIRRTPEALRAQAEYLRWEMENDPAYSRTREQFLGNPDIGYDEAHAILGDNFIRWRRNDPQYRDSGYNRIDEAYRLLGSARQAASEPQQRPTPQQRPAAREITIARDRRATETQPQTFNWLRQYMSKETS